MDLQRVTSAIKHIGRVPEVLACLQKMQDAPAIVASYVGVTPLPLPYEARFRSGVAYRLEEYYDLETLWQIYFHNVYPLTSSDRLIVDAGANIGLFTCWAASRNPEATVVAVEPFPLNFARLEQHVRRNGFERRVLAFQAALTGGESLAYLSTQASASQMLHVAAAADPGTVAVPAMALRDLLARVPGGQVDFLKMDIEGSEYPVLLSATAEELARVRRMTIEYHDVPAGLGRGKQDLVAHLRDCGFSISDAGGGAYGMLHARRTT